MKLTRKFLIVTEEEIKSFFSQEDIDQNIIGRFIESLKSRPEQMGGCEFNFTFHNCKDPLVRVNDGIIELGDDS